MISFDIVTNARNTFCFIILFFFLSFFFNKVSRRDKHSLTMSLSDNLYCIVYQVKMNLQCKLVSSFDLKRK